MKLLCWFQPVPTGYMSSSQEQGLEACICHLKTVTGGGHCPWCSPPGAWPRPWEEFKECVTSLMKNNGTYNPHFSGYKRCLLKQMQLKCEMEEIVSYSISTHDSVSLFVLFIKVHCLQRSFRYSWNENVSQSGCGHGLCGWDKPWMASRRHVLVGTDACLRNPESDEVKLRDFL